MNKQKVIIKEPCHMNWNDMDKIENSRNRHCNSCSVNIVDFTQMSNEEIIQYLSDRKNEKVCGHMYSVDARIDLTSTQRMVLGWYKNVDTKVKNHYFKTLMLAIVGVVMFMTGCETEPEVAIGLPQCWEEYVPDTTTVDPNDSTFVEVCPN